MPTSKPAVKRLTMPHINTPAIMPDMATPDTQGNTHDYVYDYTSWLCPKATPSGGMKGGQARARAPAKYSIYFIT